MAVEKNDAPRNTGNRERKENQGWLNLQITDAAGNQHNIRATIPLYDDNNVHKGMMAKGEDHEFEITGVVRLVKDQEPVEF